MDLTGLDEGFGDGTDELVDGSDDESEELFGEFDESGVMPDGCSDGTGCPEDSEGVDTLTLVFGLRPSLGREPS